MVRILGDFYILDTKETSYAFKIHKMGHLEHLYYGKRLHVEEGSDLEYLCEKSAFAPGNTTIYSGQGENFTLENLRLEFSSYGKSDIREPYIELCHEDGSMTSDFIFEEAEILDNKRAYNTLPTAYGEGENETLHIRLKDKNYSELLDLYYNVYYDTDVITRQTVLTNLSEEKIRIDRLLSCQLDLEGAGYTFTNFTGGWAREMHKNDTCITAGKIVNSSYTGTSSNRANPFVMVSLPNTDEERGECYGFNLIYSGNHYEALEVSSYNKSRFVSGINPQSFMYWLGKDESFEAPEAVMTYSSTGYSGISQNMHSFVREHIVRGEWKKKERPILLNSWEASYFNISEASLLGLAKKAKEVGIELLVMDDGWFGERNDDSSSLGDWTVNKDKLPGGIEGLSSKINALGLDFGIWVEPEMVNEKSNLYSKHPEWVIKVPGIDHSPGRNQMILDLGQEVVREYIIDQMSQVFSSGNISYVKWDMNRIFTDVYSPFLSKESQGELFHRYVLGLYSVMKTLTEKFPHILFEGCASGGNRFDLGILCYFPQIWASDDTDAIERAYIQTGLSYGYPQSTYTAHVSSVPNHQTLRRTPLETRFNVASFGILGYECNLKDSSKDELEAIKEEIAYYKKYRSLLQYGQLYRGRSFYEGEITEWTIASKDKEEAVSMQVMKLVTPNMPSGRLFVRGLLSDSRYEWKVRELKYNVSNFGDLVNSVSPVHIRQNSVLFSVIDHFYKLDGEKEGGKTFGDILMSGVYLTQNFAGTGFNENVRHFQDFSSRIYHYRKI